MTNFSSNPLDWLRPEQVHQAPTTNKLIRLASEARAKGKHDKAIGFYNQAIDFAPKANPVRKFFHADRGMLHCLLGGAYRLNGELGKADSALQKARWHFRMETDKKFTGRNNAVTCWLQAKLAAQMPGQLFTSLRHCESALDALKREFEMIGQTRTMPAGERDEALKNLKALQQLIQQDHDDAFRQQSNEMITALNQASGIIGGLETAANDAREAANAITQIAQQLNTKAELVWALLEAAGKDSMVAKKAMGEIEKGAKSVEENSEKATQAAEKIQEAQERIKEITGRLKALPPPSP